MKKSIVCFVLGLLLAVSCNTTYKTFTEGGRILIPVDSIDQEKGPFWLPKYYINDSLVFFIGIPSAYFGDEREYRLFQSTLRPLQKKALKLGKVNPRKDFVLYGDHNTLIVLRDPTSLRGFRGYTIAGTEYRPNPRRPKDADFARKVVHYKRKKFFLLDDVIPFKDKQLSVINYKSYHHPMDAFFADHYKESMKSGLYWKPPMLKTASKYVRNIREDDIPKPMGAFNLFDYFFLMGDYSNYLGYGFAEMRRGNYHTPQEKNTYAQALATYASFAHDWKKTDETYVELGVGKQNADFTIAGSVADILRGADTSRVVMFNESHHNPRHRYLVGMLLQELYDRGFTYLGMEAFFPDSLYEQRGYPTIANGYYLRDPVCGNLVRSAREIGFEVFGYDSNAKNREEAAAQNIYRNTFAKDPDARVVILAGYAHIHEKNWMADCFRALSGIEPLTVDQTYVYSRRPSNTDNTGNVWVIDTTGLQRLPNVSAVIWNDVGEMDASFGLKPSFDHSFEVSADSLTYPAIAVVYRSDELSDFERNWSAQHKPIPVWLKKLEESETHVRVRLPSGHYTLFIQNEYGMICKRLNVSIRNSGMM